MSVPKQVESIPAASVPVDLPKLVPARASYIANLVTAGALGVLAGVLLIVGMWVS